MHLLKLSPLALLACTTPELFDTHEMLVATGAGVIAPTHAALTDAASRLDADSRAFCADRGEAGLHRARDTWREVKEPLKRIEAWSFGPYRVLGVELSKTVDKWPGDATEIEAVLARPDAIDDAFVEALDYTTRVKGYPAVEYLLWSDADPASTVARFTGDDGDRRCEYLIALTGNALGYVDGYAARWSPDGGDYLGELTTAGQGSAVYGTVQDAVTALVSGMLTATTDAGALKLGVPAGEASGGTADPLAVEAPFSDASSEHARWAVEGAQALYLGSPRSGLSAYVQDRQAAGDVDGAVKAAFTGALTAIAAIPGPLEVAVVDDPAAVADAIDAVEALSIVLNGELSTLLGVNPSAVEGDND